MFCGHRSHAATGDNDAPLERARSASRPSFGPKVVSRDPSLSMILTETSRGSKPAKAWSSATWTRSVRAPANSTPVGPPPTITERQQSSAALRVRFPSRGLELFEESAAQGDRVVDVGRRRQTNLHTSPGDQRTQRTNDLGGRQEGRGDLVQERREELVVVAVDESHGDPCTREVPGGRHAGEASTNHDDHWPGRSARGQVVFGHRHASAWLLPTGFGAGRPPPRSNDPARAGQELAADDTHRPRPRPRPGRMDAVQEPRQERLGAASRTFGRRAQRS